MGGISSHPRTLHILLDIVDNFGDIGCVLEFAIAWKHTRPQDTLVIWTNQPLEAKKFFQQTAANISCTIYAIDQCKKIRDSQAIVCVFFHTSLQYIPKIPFHLILHIGHLSLDPLWTKYHMNAHITSTKERKIIEIIPSPLSSGGGLLLPMVASYQKEQCIFLSNISTLQHKHWCVIFAYQDTLTNIDFSCIKHDTHVFILGHSGNNTSQISFLPILAIKDFYALIQASDVCIVRGEMSASFALQTRSLFFWDIYHTIGGDAPSHQQDFLQWINTQNEAFIHWQQYIWQRKNIPFQLFFDEMMQIPKTPTTYQIKNLIHTCQTLIG